MHMWPPKVWPLFILSFKFQIFKLGGCMLSNGCYYVRYESLLVVRLKKIRGTPTSDERPHDISYHDTRNDELEKSRYFEVISKQ